MDPELVKQAVSAYLLPLIQAEAARMLPSLEAQLPGSLRKLAESILASPAIQKWIKDAEAEGLSWLLDKGEQLLINIRDAIRARIAHKDDSPKVVNLDQTADGALPRLHLSAAQVKAMAILAPGALDKLLGLAS